MADSTCLVAAPLDSWPARWNAEKRRRRAARRELTQGIEMRALSAAAQLIDRKSGRPSGRGVSAHIVCQTALVLGRVWQDTRRMERRVVAFRVLGDLARRDGLSGEAAVGMIESGVQAALALVRHEVGDRWRNDSLAAVLRNLEDEAQAFAREARQELRLGMLGDLRPTENTASVLLRLLDGRLVGDELGAAAAAIGLDASREHGLVLLVHPHGSTCGLEAASKDVEATIPRAVDLGLSDAVPISCRLVFPVLTHGRWIEARTHLHDIATNHGVLAVAPVAAPTLYRLAETYQATERELARVVQECGYTSGIIDPACIGPACKAEGTSPGPDDPWSVEMLAFSHA